MSKRKTVYEDIQEPHAKKQKHDAVVTYKDGYKRSVTEYIDGIKDGVEIVYSNVETVLVTQQWKNNVKNGSCFEYSTARNGCQFISRQTTWKDGKLNGICRSWDHFGCMVSDCNYTDNLLDGKSRMWVTNKEGEPVLIKKYNYSKGYIIGRADEWYNDGQLTARENYNGTKYT